MRIGLTLATAFAFAVLSAEAQMRIEGRVLDPSGLPVQGLTVNAADWHSAGGASASAQTSDDGSFTIHVPPGIYAIGTGVPLPPLNPGLARADVRGGNVTGLDLRLSAQTLVVPDDPPRASLIEIIPSGSGGTAIVRGGAGAVSPGAFLILVTLDTGDATTAIASEDGSFQVPLHAPPGSSVLVKADPLGFAFRMASQRLPQNSAGMHLSLLGGTIVHNDFPNLDLNDAEGFAGADTITISFLMSGTDATGERKHFARQIVIQGEEPQMPAQAPAPLRRRPVRR